MGILLTIIAGMHAIAHDAGNNGGDSIIEIDCSVHAWKKILRWIGFAQRKPYQ